MNEVTSRVYELITKDDFTLTMAKIKVSYIGMDNKINGLEALIKGLDSNIDTDQVDYLKIIEVIKALIHF
jgi:hypothetical protein